MVAAVPGLQPHLLADRRPARRLPSANLPRKRSDVTAEKRGMSGPVDAA